MAVQRIVLISFATAITAVAGLFPTSVCARQNAASGGMPSVQDYLGSWDLTVEAAQIGYPSWLGVTQENGELKGQFVGQVGSIHPVSKIDIQNGALTFTAPQGKFEGRLVGQVLTGTTTGADGMVLVWTGRRMPALKRSGPLQWEAPVTLFNGKDLSGWRPSDPANGGNWAVENGTLIVTGQGAELVSTCTFQDFKLHVEFKLGPKANSGVFLRGRYEIQIESDAAGKPPSHHTGALYSMIAPSPDLPRKIGAWQSFDITLIGRTLTVVQNGQTIINAQEVPSITGGALDSREELPGPIYLQGTEKGGIAFRHIVITPARE